MGKARVYKGRLLYRSGDNYIVRDPQGKVRKIPVNRFQHKQIVRSSKAHFSCKDFTRLLDPCYVFGRGWVYTENYWSNHIPGFSGCGSSFEEKLYVELTDAAMILKANQIMLKEDIADLSTKLKNKKEQLDKIEFAIELLPISNVKTKKK